MKLRCLRCDKPLEDGNELVCEEPMPNRNGELVCANCVYASIPDQPPMPQEQIDRILRKVQQRIHAQDN